MIKTISLLTTILFISVGCVTHAKGTISYKAISNCGPSYSCPPYCGVRHKHCKGVMTMDGGIKELDLNISSSIVDTIK